MDPDEHDQCLLLISTSILTYGLQACPSPVWQAKEVARVDEVIVSLDARDKGTPDQSEGYLDLQKLSQPAYAV